MEIHVHMITGEKYLQTKWDELPLEFEGLQYLTINPRNPVYATRVDPSALVFSL